MGVNHRYRPFNMKTAKVGAARPWVPAAMYPRQIYHLADCSRCQGCDLPSFSKFSVLLLLFICSMHYWPSLATYKDWHERAIITDQVDSRVGQFSGFQVVSSLHEAKDHLNLSVFNMTDFRMEMWLTCKMCLLNYTKQHVIEKSL